MRRGQCKGKVSEGRSQPFPQLDERVTKKNKKTMLYHAKSMIFTTQKQTYFFCQWPNLLEVEAVVGCEHIGFDLSVEAWFADAAAVLFWDFRSPTPDPPLPLDTLEREPPWISS